MDETTPPKGATTPPVEGLNGTAPGGITPDEADALNRARLAADVQTIRRGIDRIGPAVFVIAYFAAMACLFLAIIARRLGK